MYGINQGDLALNSGNYDLSYRENVGVYGINQGDLALNSGNYDLSYQVYGDADPSLTYQVSGLKNGDTAGAAPPAPRPGPGEVIRAESPSSPPAPKSAPPAPKSVPGEVIRAESPSSPPAPKSGAARAVEGGYGGRQWESNPIFRVVLFGQLQQRDNSRRKRRIEGETPMNMFATQGGVTRATWH